MKIFATIIMAFVVMACQGQDIKTIEGSIGDFISKSRLAGVKISSPRDVFKISNQSGEFKIKAAEGDTLIFQHLGYISNTIVVKKNPKVNVLLRQHAMAIDEVTVNGIQIEKKMYTAASTNVIGSSSPKFRGVSRHYLPVQSNTESYKGFTDNKFLNPLKDPLSTFAADVDVASYNNMKRLIKSGQVPPVDAIRLEEMINYFQYQLEGPKGQDPIAIHTELSPSPWNKNHKLMKIAIKAKDIPKAELAASNFVFLIDISGSMETYNKLPMVKSSLKILVDQLREQDRVSIVTYAGNANIALESISGDKKMRIKEVIDGLQAGGGTAGGDGLMMAYNIARKNFIASGNNRIVMATDGDFNVGSSSDSNMQKLIEKERISGVNISVLGYGMGNYKDSKLELLANKGRGNYAYINDITEARKAMVTEFGGTLHTVAKDVKIQVEFNPQNVLYYRLVGYENRLMEAEDFNNDTKVGGDMGVGHVVTAIYDIVPVGVSSDVVANIDPLKYQKSEKKNNLGASNNEVATVKFRFKDIDKDKSRLIERVVRKDEELAMSSDFKFATAVAELGMLLRNSEFKQESNFDQLIQRAKRNKGTDDEGYRAEFIRLAEDAKLLMQNEVYTKY